MGTGLGLVSGRGAPARAGAPAQERGDAAGVGADAVEPGGRPLEGDAAGTPEIAPAVGTNLRRLRVKRGLSLQRLAQRAGVSRAMLSQIELGQSTPTINLLWKVARALDVTFSALIVTGTPTEPRVLGLASAKVLTNREGTFTSRALFPFDQPRRAEFYELRLKARAEERADPHPPGTSENLVVTAGQVEIDVQQLTYRLGTGDAITFAADGPHVYRNPGDVDATMYLVMTYPQDVG